MGCCLNYYKTSYYKLVKKNLKKSFDNIITSEFNKYYSIQLKKFEDNKKKKNDADEENNINWKGYLLDKLFVKKTTSWKYHLYNYILNDQDIVNSNYNIYFFENRIFTEQFFLLSFPQLYYRDSKRKEDPVIFLFSQDELKSYYSNSNKISKSRKNTHNEIELSTISLNSKDDDIEDKDKDKIEEDKYLNIGDSQTLMNGEFSIDFDNLEDERVLFKYNTFKIREQINLIRKQIEAKEHPINKIIKKFSEFYTYKIKKEIENENIQNNISKIESVKKEIIKDIQEFIEIISVSLKLFYSKTINYEFFKSERDEFLNLICYILFKEKEFYNNVFELFNLSNMKKIENFQNKKEELKEVTPKDAGISIQFRLNEETNQLRNSNFDISDNSKSKVFIEFLTAMDLSRERYYSSISKEEANIENDISHNRTSSFLVGSKAPSIKTINDNKLKVKKERKKSIKSYKDFSEAYNNQSISLQDKIEINLRENPSNLEIISVNEFQSKLNNKIIKPYGEAIEYIQTIKDYNTPLDKLTIIALTSVLITKCIDKFWKGKKITQKKFLNVNADELMSIYLYIIYNMNLYSIYTQLDFIRYFTGSITKQSIIGYYYTTIEGSLAFIMSAKTKEDLTRNLKDN